MTKETDAESGSDVAGQSETKRQVAPHAGDKHQRATTSEAETAKTSHASQDVEETIVMDDEDKAAGANTGGSLKAGKLKALHANLWQWAMAHKPVSIPAACVLLVLLLAALPFTRFALAGLVAKQTLPVAVVDATTHKPITSATVTLDGQVVTTNAQGLAKPHVAVGPHTLTITKKYYKTVSQSATVPILKAKHTVEISLTATGRQVPITVLSTIDGQPLANVTVKALESSAVTDKKGQAIVVLPADKKSLAATISGGGYNTANVTITVTDQAVSANTFKVTPAGKLYFLSNASGKIDLIKSDLDGQNRQTVLAGTGSEDRTGTVLLAARDWKYAALLSKRDGGDHAKLFLVDTSTDKLTTMDEGDADFSPLGWSGDRFVYTVTRTKINSWQPKREALKSYDATTGKITLLDETTAQGDQSDYAGEHFGDSYILDKEIVYIKNWGSNEYYGYNQHYISADQSTLNSVQADGSQKKKIKGYSFPGESYLSVYTRPGDFNEIYIQYYLNSKENYDSYQNGKVAAASLTDDQYYNGNYHTFIVSPSGNKTFWTEYLDGQNVFFVGDADGQNGKKLEGSSDDYAAYGWFSDDYVLVTKKSSEMYIMPASGLAGGVGAALKVSNYYKPNYVIRGYGYGYGG